MEQSEFLSSAGSGSYGVTQMESDDTLSEGCSEETLNLVEGAILQTLSKHVPERHSEESKRVRGRLNNGRGEEQQSVVSESDPKSSNPKDMELLANLLEQVHDLRRIRRQGSRKPKETPPPQDVLKPVKRRKKPSSYNEELRMTLEAATMAAQAAADAAEAAAVSVARNTEAIEIMVNSMKKRKKSKSDEKKAIVKSNQITHWILAFMAITTIAWRFGVVKVVKGISSKVSDPLAYVGGLIGGNDDSSTEESVENDTFFDKLPHFDMPEFIPNDWDPNNKESKAKEAEETKADKETSLVSKSAAAVENKTKEVEKTAFSFANFLQIKPKKT